MRNTMLGQCLLLRNMLAESLPKLATIAEVEIPHAVQAAFNTERNEPAVTSTSPTWMAFSGPTGTWAPTCAPCSGADGTTSMADLLAPVNLMAPHLPVLAPDLMALVNLLAPHLPVLAPDLMAVVNLLAPHLPVLAPDLMALVNLLAPHLPVLAPDLMAVVNLLAPHLPVLAPDLMAAGLSSQARTQAKVAQGLRCHTPT